MKMKNILSTWLVRKSHRFDSKPFMSGAREARVILDKPAVKKAPLDSLAEIYHPGRESRAWVNDPKHGTPFLGGSSILAADLSSLPLISNKKIAQKPRFIIHEGWTLITRSGTVGRMVYARPEMDGMACSEDV
ncbi:MAG: restriction endonuclease subunit S, partial [Gammaproteobacteria bacterium]|nr:restriction endonuclease subunit S [Gammaproteobacteria bacterium]